MARNAEQPIITSQPQPSNNPVTLDSENHELTGMPNDSITPLDPSVLSPEQQEELKQKAKESIDIDKSSRCCKAITDFMELCFDMIGCCNDECCNDGCCNDGCCNYGCCDDGCCDDGCCDDGCCNDDCFED